MDSHEEKELIQSQYGWHSQLGNRRKARWQRSPGFTWSPLGSAHPLLAAAMALLVRLAGRQTEQAERANEIGEAHVQGRKQVGLTPGQPT